MRKFLSVFLVLWAGTAHANDYDAALRATCENFKSCTYKEFEGQQLTPELKKMVEMGAEAACSGIDSIFILAKPKPEILALGTSCLWSMSRMTCGELNDFELTATPECKTYYERAMVPGQ